MKSTPAPARVAALAVFLVVLGFTLGMGYQTLQYATGQNKLHNGTASNAPRPPLVRGLRVSPDDGMLAFTAIYQNSEQAGRFLFDLKTYQWNEAKTPTGWQDSITQWSKDGKRILFARERIPRPAGEGAPGLYQEPVTAPEKGGERKEPQSLSENAEPSGEKAYAGFWTPGGKLVMKTRRESKSLFLKQGDSANLIDRSPGTYYQNRALLENGVLTYYVVRDISTATGEVGLFRIQNGRAKRLGSPLRDVVWAYVAENARWMIICRPAANMRDWEWSLYRISPTQLQLAKEKQIPEDVIAVYWSPDFQKILGAAGKSLWLIDVPTLQTRILGDRNDWNADDAAWLSKENKVIIAAAGRLWKIDIATGKRTEMWKFPSEYWK